jgi:4'-phosphopantetheinyl transferase
MPIIKALRFNSQTELILWEIKESEEELMQKVQLSDSENQKLLQRKSEAHRLEFLSSRACIQALGIAPHELLFHDNGAPYLNNQRFCSISHTTQYAAAAISDQRIGIDVETYRERILRIAPKFTHKEEVFALEEENKIQLLTRIWTAKEAIYKAFGTPGIHFSKQIQVDPFTLDDDNGFARLLHSNQEYSFTLKYTSINNGELCIALMNP